MYRLKCTVQQYEWGKKGKESAVAQLMEIGTNDFIVEASEPYAELWMGTHVNGPSYIITSDGEELLSEWIVKHPDVCGSSAKLPYLFKVLSVNKALSIQAHPDKPLAQILHSERPEIYKDSNHKPEMAVALTPFETLCQFRPLEEITENLKEVKEFSGLIDEQILSQFIKCPNKSNLKCLFTSFMNSSKDSIESEVSKLSNRLIDKGESLSELDKLVLRLIDQYSFDIGVFCPYLMNYVVLQPGEAIFLGANEPHAYLDGNCMECMACSDNVVRAGLTPKYIDKDTLYSMLTYKYT